MKIFFSKLDQILFEFWILQCYIETLRWDQDCCHWREFPTDQLWRRNRSEESQSSLILDTEPVLFRTVPILRRCGGGHPILRKSSNNIISGPFNISLMLFKWRILQKTQNISTLWKCDSQECQIIIQNAIPSLRICYDISNLLFIDNKSEYLIILWIWSRMNLILYESDPVWISSNVWINVLGCRLTVRVGCNTDDVWFQKQLIK